MTALPPRRLRSPFMKGFNVLGFTVYVLVIGVVLVAGSVWRSLTSRLLSSHLSKWVIFLSPVNRVLRHLGCISLLTLPQLT